MERIMESQLNPEARSFIPTQTQYSCFNPEAQEFFPTRISSTLFDPEAQEFIPTLDSKRECQQEVVSFSSGFNPSASPFIPLKRLNPFAKDFHPANFKMFEENDLILVTLGEFETGNGKKPADTTETEISRLINLVNTELKLSDESNRHRIESCDAASWKFWRPRFSETATDNADPDKVDWFKFHL